MRRGLRARRDQPISQGGGQVVGGLQVPPGFDDSRVVVDGCVCEGDKRDKVLSKVVGDIEPMPRVEDRLETVEYMLLP